MKKLLSEAANRSIRYLENLPLQRVYPAEENLSRLKELDIALPDSATKPEDVLAVLDEIGSPTTVTSAGGRYFGFVTGGVLPAALAANWLAGAWDQPADMVVASPIGAKIEEVAIKWLLEVLSLPKEASVGFVTGATMANFVGLAAARHAMLKKHGWEVELKGLFGAPELTIVVSEIVHVSLLKALSMLGLGRERIIRVPVDHRGRMRIDAFPPLNDSTIVCIQAGNVYTGDFDPAQEICDIAHKAGAWVHIDGAFGVWASATPSKKSLTNGIEHADSWALDAHKWLNVPYDSGIVVCRNEGDIRAAMSYDADYLIHGDEREPGLYTPEMSRRARGIEVWAALLSLGKSGLSDLIERTCHYANYFAQELSKEGYEILNEVVLNQVLVSFGDQAKTEKIIEEVQKDGTCWCGGTTWQGKTAMRISVSCWATNEDDVNKSLSAIKRIAKRF